MNPIDQATAIALACGYRWYQVVKGLNEAQDAFVWATVLRYPPEEGIGKAWIGQAGETRVATPEQIASAISDGWYSTYHPDYLGSHDAMAQAIATLNPDEQARYFHELHRMLYRGHMSLFHQQWLPVILATPAQQAECFLRAKGLWRNA